MWNKYEASLNSESLTDAWDGGNGTEYTEIRIQAPKGRLHAETTYVTGDRERKVKLVCDRKALLVCEVANAIFLPAFAE